MGKVRVAKLGDQTTQEEQREKRSRQREEKKKRAKVHIAGMKGGERLVAMTSEDEVDKLAKIAEVQEKIEEEMASGKVAKEDKVKEKKKVKTKTRGKKYTAAFMKIKGDTLYNIEDAVSLLKEIPQSKFDASVEVHVNTTEKGLRGSVTLPHGTGKKQRIVILSPTDPSTSLGTSNSIIVGGEELIEKISSGWTDFDILVTHPSMMPKLTKVARILGPKGLMPNPKAGTISDKPEELVKKLSGGQIQFKTESEFPIIHQVIGKVSFGPEKLVENYQALIAAIGVNKIRNVTLKSTMSPGIKVVVS